MSFRYPIVLDVTDVPVLVVGAGRVACRKIDGLLDAGAAVRVVAPEIDAALDVDRIHALRRRRYEPSDLDDMRLVVTATGDADVDAAVATDARHRRIWVNAADQPVDCTFILPAIARAGDLSAAVSSDGTSPAIASWLRDRIRDEILTADVVEIAAAIAAERQTMIERGDSTEQHDWRSDIERLLAERVDR